MSIVTTYPFTTPSNYSYDSDKIEVNSGVAKLKNLETPTDFIENFNDSNGLTFDPNLIEVVGGEKLALKLGASMPMTFTEDFADDTGFVYDSDNVEFAGGGGSAKRYT